MSNEASPVRFGPHPLVWAGLAAVVVAAVIGWRVQRRYFPTCGQVAEHTFAVIEEAEPDAGREISPGVIKQVCVDEGWSTEERRDLMGAETASQVKTFQPYRRSRR
jgi:hypothetical protein